MIACRCYFGVIATLCLSLGVVAAADQAVRTRFTAYSESGAVRPDGVSVAAAGSRARVLSAAAPSQHRPLLILIDPNSYSRQELRARLGRFAQALAAPRSGPWRVRIGIPVLDGILGPEVADMREVATVLDHAVTSYVPEQPAEPLTAGRTLDSISELVGRAEQEAAGPVDCLLLFRDRLFEGEASAYLNEGMARRLASAAFGQGSTLYGWLDGDGILRRACTGSGGMAWGTGTAPTNLLERLAGARGRAITLDVELQLEEPGRTTTLDVRCPTADGSESRLRAPEAFWGRDGGRPPGHRGMQQALDWIRRARDARSDGNFTLARRFADSAIEEDRWNPEGYLLSAESALELGDFPSAREAAARGIAGAGPDERILVLFASASRRMGNAADVLPRLQKLLPKDRAPSPELRLELARLYAATGELAAARELFADALEGQRDPGVLAESADVLLRLGLRDEARSQLTVALEADRNNVRAMVLLAQTFAAEGDSARAHEWAAKAAERNSTEPETLAGLAAVHAGLREWLPAIESLHRALTLAPGRRDLARQYVDALRRARRERDAIAFLQKSIETDPSDQGARRTLGDILSDIGALEEAATIWESAAAAAGPDAHDLYRAAAALRERRGEYGQALLDYRAMLRTAPPEVSGQLRAAWRPHLSAIALLAGAGGRAAGDPLAKELDLPASSSPSAVPVPDNGSLPADFGTMEVPGGLAILARTVGVGVPAPGDTDVLERMFTLILDSGSTHNSRLQDDPVRRDAVSALRTSAALMRHMTAEGLLPPDFDPHQPRELAFPLYGTAETTNRARKLLRFFGVHLGIKQGRDGAVHLTLTLKQGGAAAARQQFLRNLGVPLTDRAVREIRFTPQQDRIPILLDSRVWADRILPPAKKQYGLLERFLLNPSAMRLYLALAGCSKSARAGLVEAYGPGELLEVVEQLSAYGRYLDLPDGNLAFPGERKSWEALLGTAGPGNRPALNALLRRDDWRALRIYASLTLAPPSVRQYLTSTPERLKRLHEVFLTSARGGKTASQLGQPDLGRLFALMEADGRGLLLPIDRRLAPAVFPGTPAGGDAARPGTTEPLVVRDQELGRFMGWAGSAGSQVPPSPLDAIELICWLQTTHPVMLDGETAGEIVRNPAAAASMVDLVVDLSPPAPLLRRYIAFAGDLAAPGPRGAGRMRTGQALICLISLLTRQGALNRAAGLGLLETALAQLNGSEDGTFGRAAVRFLSQELLPSLRQATVGTGADETLFGGLAGPVENRELSYDGRRLRFDAAAYQLQRMKSAIMHQSVTPLDRLLEAFRLTGTGATVEQLRSAVSLIRAVDLTRAGEGRTRREGIAGADLEKLAGKLASAPSAGGAAPATLALEVAQALNTELGVTLLSFCYAFHGAPEADVLAFDPNFVRKHDFFAGAPDRGGPWAATRLEQKAGTGSYCTGSLSGLGFELSRLETAQWAQDLGDREERSLVPTVLAGMRSVRRALRSDRAQEYVALSVRLGRELLATAAVEGETRRWCEAYLRRRLLPRRRDEVLEALAAGSPLRAAAALSASELLLLGRQWLGEKTVENSPVLSSPVAIRLKAIVPAADQSASFQRELDQYGIFLRRRIGISQTTASIPDSYEQLDQAGGEEVLFERICDLKIRLADLHYGMGIPAFLGEAEGELAVQEILPRSLAARAGTWKTALEQIGRLGVDDARRWIEDLATRGVLAAEDGATEAAARLK